MNFKNHTIIILFVLLLSSCGSAITGDDEKNEIRADQSKWGKMAWGSGKWDEAK